MKTRRAIDSRKSEEQNPDRSKQKLPLYKGRRVYTEEETAQQDCPFPDESEWVAELERFHDEKEKRLKSK